MTKTIFGGSDRPRLKALAHYGSMVVIGALTLVCVFTLLGWHSWVASAITIGGTAAGVILLYLHTTGPLCERCMAGMPLNGPEMAERRRLLLRFAHTSALWVLAGGVALQLAITPLVHATYWRGVISVGTVTGPMIGIYFVFLMHARLRLWCPWCRRGGGGNGDVAPAPDPREDHGRPLPSVR